MGDQRELGPMVNGATVAKVYFDRRGTRCGETDTYWESAHFHTTVRGDELSDFRVSGNQVRFRFTDSVVVSRTVRGVPWEGAEIQHGGTGGKHF